MQKIKNQKGRVPLIVLGAIVFLLVGIGSGYVVSKKTISVSKCTTGVIEKGGFISKCGVGVVERKEQENKTEEESRQTEDWKAYKNEQHGFEMKYPKEFEKISASNFESKRGSINLSVLPEKFDPQNIQGILEKIKNPALVKIGNKDGYQYNEADGGCAWEKIRTGLNNNATLDISFVSCGDNLDSGLTPVMYDKILIAQVLSTFKFTDQTADWKTYKNEEYGFEMKYPDEFAQRNVEKTVVLENKNRGHISIYVVSKKLDPKNIQGLYGKIENPILVKVGDKDGYQYGDGDAGCEAEIVQIDLNGRILNIAFGSCEADGDINAINKDSKLINQVLSSFKFSE